MSYYNLNTPGDRRPRTMSHYDQHIRDLYEQRRFQIIEDNERIRATNLARERQLQQQRREEEERYRQELEYQRPALAQQAQFNVTRQLNTERPYGYMQSNDWRSSQDYLNVEKIANQPRARSFHARSNANNAREVGRLAAARQEQHHIRNRIARGDPIYNPEQRERELDSYWNDWILKRDSRGEQCLKNIRTQEVSYDSWKINKYLAEENRRYNAQARASERSVKYRKAREEKYKKNFSDVCEDDANWEEKAMAYALNEQEMSYAGLLSCLDASSSANRKA